MGRFSELASQIQEAGYALCECDICGGLAKLEDNTDEYEKALYAGYSSMGNCKFVRSCNDFYKKNGFLTDKQMAALKKNNIRQG